MAIFRLIRMSSMRGDFFHEIDSRGWFLDENRYHHEYYAYDKAASRDGAVKDKIFLSVCLALFIIYHFHFLPFPWLQI